MKIKTKRNKQKKNKWQNSSKTEHVTFKTCLAFKTKIQTFPVLLMFANYVQLRNKCSYVYEWMINSFTHPFFIAHIKWLEKTEENAISSKKKI